MLSQKDHLSHEIKWLSRYRVKSCEFERLCNRRQMNNPLEEIEAVKGECISVRREIEKAIRRIRTGVDAVAEQAVLRGRYIFCLNWPDVSEMILGGRTGFNLQRVAELHADAINALGDILRSGDFPSFESRGGIGYKKEIQEMSNQHREVEALLSTLDQMAWDADASMRASKKVRDQIRAFLNEPMSARIAAALSVAYDLDLKEGDTARDALNAAVLRKVAEGDEDAKKVVEQYGLC